MLAGVFLFSFSTGWDPSGASYFSLLANREFEPLQIESDDLKPEIQVVTVDPPSSLPENIKGQRKADKK